MNRTATVPAAAKKPPRVQSAARTVDILLAIANSGPPGISAKKLSEDLELPRQVVYHLLHTLSSVDIIRKSAGNAYVLGIAASVIANGYKRQTAAPEQLGRYAERVAQLTGETAYLVGWLDEEIVVLANARGNLAIQAAEIPPGTAGDAHARASGKLLLALSAEDEVARYLALHPMKRRTPNTITTRTAFARELEKIRLEQISIDREEYAAGLTCIAVPVGRAGSRYVVGLSGPTERVNAKLETYIEALHQVALG